MLSTGFQTSITVLTAIAVAAYPPRIIAGSVTASSLRRQNGTIAS